MKKKLSNYCDISGISDYDFWSYCADNDMWYEDEKEVLPIPLAKSEIVKDLICEIKIDHNLYREQNWEDASPEDELKEYAQYIIGRDNAADCFSSAILLRTPKQDLPICISQEGMWYLNCFLTQLETQNFSAEYIEQWFDLKFIAWTYKNNNTRLVVHSYMDGYKFLQTIFDITINRDILISKLKNIIDIWKRKVYTAIKRTGETSNLTYDYALDKFFPQLKLLSYYMVQYKLFPAIEKGDLTEVKQILKEDIDINVTIQDETPLMCACRLGKVDIAKILIDAGADTNIKNSLDYTALDIAKEEKNEELIKLLQDSK